MKKLITSLLIIVSLFGYGQTYQNPTFGTVTTKTSPTVTNDPYLTTTGTTGVQGKIAPVNVLIPYTPINYTISGQTIGQQIAAIDAKIGTMGTTSAGVTQRVYFTADNTTVNSVIYFASSLSGKGSAATGSPPDLVLADNTKAFFTKDVISIAQPAPTIGYAGTYSGNLTVSASPTPVATQQRFTVEIYRTDNLGVPIASGVSGAPVGDLGVTVLAILDSGIINLTAGSITNIAVSGSLTQNITLNTGERLRYHVSAAKIGAGGGNVTFGVYYGTSYNSYYDIPVAITTDAVLDRSDIPSAVTATDALNTLNTLKANLASPTFTGNVTVPTPTLANDAVNKSYADGLIVGLLDDRGSYNASSNLFPSTGGSGSGGTILKGDIWYVSVAGTLGGKAVAIGDSFRAIADSPGQTSSNWSLLSSNLSYVPANDANVIHNTGDETKTGMLTLNKQTAGTNTLTSNNNDNSVGARFNNTANGYGQYSNNTSSGTNAFFVSGSLSTGSNVVANQQGTGFNFVGQNDNSNTFTVNKLGDVIGNSFGKIGGTASQFLKANGSIDSNSYANLNASNTYTNINNFTGGSVVVNDPTLAQHAASKNYTDSNFQLKLTNPVTGTGTANFISKFTGSGTIGNSQIFDNGSSVGVGTVNPDLKMTISSNTASLLHLENTLATSNGSHNVEILSYKSGVGYNNMLFDASKFIYRLIGSSVAMEVGSSGVNISNLAGTGTRTVVADASGNLSATDTPPSRPYKVWVGVFQNNGTSAPTVIVNENTLGGTVVWTRTTTGTYRGTLSGVFNATSGKTNLLFGGGAGITSNGFFNQMVGTANYVEFTTLISGSLSDSVLNGFTWVEIRVYP